MKIGAQLFTLREFCKTLDALGETLCRVADMGYTSVQVSGTCPYTPEELLPLLKKAGVTCDLTHYNPTRVAEDTEAVIDEHKRMGCSAIGLGSMPGLFTPDANLEKVVVDFVDTYTRPSQKIAEAGLHFMYHNHDKEYLHTINGMSVMAYLAEQFPAKQLGFTLDLYWVQKGGMDPIAEIKRLHNRLHCVHLKDMEAGTQHFAPVGSGIQNYPAMLAALEDAGTAFAFVEQDNCYGQDPFACLKQSYDYLTSLGLS